MEHILELAEKNQRESMGSDTQDRYYEYLEVCRGRD